MMMRPLQNTSRQTIVVIMPANTPVNSTTPAQFNAIKQMDNTVPINMPCSPARMRFSGSATSAADTASNTGNTQQLIKAVIRPSAAIF
ncbi:hypothetical protein [Solimicrobium silvestre]|uniref:hypothetical protein n=1 Tax=Solimicrobium silvestre TaxID=2099400 RepID=UPI0010571A3B|nr:hypothetical protein [Solimicrobium silvestre]